MKRKSSPLTVLTRPQVLDYGERGALLIAIVSGTMAMVQSSALQLAAPAMSLSLLLGYFNRRQMHQGLLQHVVSVGSEVRQLTLKQRWASDQPADDAGQVEEQVAFLLSQQDGIHQALAEMHQQVQAIPSDKNWETLQQSHIQLCDRVEALQNSHGVDSNNNSVALQISQVQAAQHNMGVQLQVQLEELQYDLGTLKSSVETLASVEALTPVPASEADTSSGHDTTSSQETASSEFQSMVHTIDQLKGQIESLSQSIQPVEEPTVPSESPIDIVMVAERVNGLKQQVETWENRFEQHRINLKQGLSAMPQMIEQSIEEYQNLHPVEVGVKSEELYVLQRHVQQQLAALGAKLEQVILRFSRDIKALGSQVQVISHQGTGTHGVFKPSSGGLIQERLTTATPLSVRSAIESQDTSKRSAVAMASPPQTLTTPANSAAQAEPNTVVADVSQDPTPTSGTPNWDSMLNELNE
jgi:hypothetical protein